MWEKRGRLNKVNRTKTFVNVGKNEDSKRGVKDSSNAADYETRGSGEGLGDSGKTEMK